ncbi:MAG TPA: RidA family protein [Thermodesulfobacteriota bacterium]
MATREIVRSGTAPKDLPLSPAVKSGGLIYTSGMLGTDPETGRLVEGGIGPQTRQALENLERTLEAAGSGLDKVVKATVFITDTANFQGMNEVYRQYFPVDPPARSTVRCDLVLPGALVEIELVAVAG